MLRSIYKPVIVDKIPDNCVQLLFSYYGVTCKVFEYDDKIIVPKGTKVAELNKDKVAVQEIKWLIPARRNFTDNNSVVIYNLEFNSRNKAGNFIYGNSIRATQAFHVINKKEEKCNMVDTAVTAIIDAFSKVSPSEKRAIGEAMISSANREDLSKVLEPFINNVEKLQDNVEQICDDVKSLTNPYEDIAYLYPYKLRLERVKRGDDEYNKSLERLSLILNQENITDVLKKLKRTGVYLAGDAGIGKGIIANSIGAKIVADNEHYNEYAKMFVNCHEIMNMAQVSWGTGMNNVEYLGAVYSAFKFGNDNKDCAVILVFDEVNRCDARALLGAIYELVSSKRDKSYCKVCNGETLVYTDNIYIVITGNIGNAYKTGGLTDDTGFADRFRFVGLTGIFEDIKFVDKYMEYVKNELYPEISVDEIYSVLVDIYDVVQENSKVSKTISLRNLSNNIEESTSKEDFMNRVKSMFSAGDRERLGWYD